MAILDRELTKEKFWDEFIIELLFVDRHNLSLLLK